MQKLSYNIIQPFLASAKKHPERIALIEKEDSITYGRLEKEVKQMAAYYRSEGIQAGDRVMVFVPMSIDLYRSVLALFYIGATAVFLDEWVDKKRLEYCTDLAHCKAFIGSWKLKALALISKPLYNIPLWLELGAFKYYKADQEMQSVQEDHTALLTFTTGSTGKAKAAQRSHAFLYEQFLALNDKIVPQATDVAMPVLPIVLLCNLGVGACSIIAEYPSRKPTSFKPGKTVKTLIDQKVNRITSSPYFIKCLATFCLDNNISIPNLTNIFTGGAPVFPDEAALYLKAFPDADIQIVYGSTEAEPISSISAAELCQKPQLAKGLKVGNIYHKTELKIVPVVDEALSFNNEEELENFQLKSGEVGEIIVAGDHVLKTYYKAPQAWKQNKISTGEKLWHRTGDSGFIDQNGDLYLCGRTKQLIPLHQSNYLSPFIFEGMLQEMKEVNIGTIINHEDQLLIIAEVIESTAKDSLLTKIRELMTHLIPNGYQGTLPQIKLVDLIPRDPRHHSKIDYNRMKQMYC